MSVRLMASIWDHAPLKGAKLLLLLAIADHANDDGICWPSVTRIATKTRMSERQVQRLVEELCDEELLCVTRIPGKASLYLVNVTPDISNEAPPTFSALPPTFSALGGDIAMSGEPSVLEPSVEPTEVEETSKEVRPTATQIEREAVERIWAFWLGASAKKQRLDDKRRRIIRSALALAGEESVKQALLGLTRSPHHQGQNEQRRPYMEIRYALKGIGDESDEERIEKAISWAAIHSPQQEAVDPEKVDRWLEEVRYTMSLPHRPERARAKEAWSKLKAAGFTVTQLDKPPWVRIER